MAPRWIGTRAGRSISVTLSGYLIRVRENPRTAGGNSTSRPSRKEQPAEGGGEPFPGPTASRFSAARMSSAAPTRETGLKNSPPRGWRNCSPGRLLH